MATKTEIPPFKGTPMIEIPKVIPTAGFLEGDFGKAVLEEYNRRKTADYNGAVALNVLSLQGDVVTGSNPYAVVLVNQILREAGMRTATPSDLGQIIDAEACDLDLRGTYEDAALVLYSTDGANQGLAQSLYEQLGQQELPVMIPLKDLELVVGDSKHLNFTVLDDAAIVYASQLKAENNGKRFTQTDQNGLPVFDEKGAKTAYTASNGLRRFCRDRTLILGADYDLLPYSFGAGRVVIIGSSEAAQNFS